MAFNGSGTFIRIYNWVTDKINAAPITASRMDTEMDGMATGLSNCITKDGQTVISANIPMSSHKFTGLSVGNARSDSITLGQVQDGQYTYLGTAGGAADAYIVSPAPAITAYVATMSYRVKIQASNATTTPYLQLSSIGTPASDAVIKKLDASKAEIAVEVNDMLANGLYNLQRNSANTAWILMNPEKSYDKYLILDSQAINNLSIAASVAASALTISLKTKAGTDATTFDPIKISFRNPTLTTGTYNTRSVTAATSVVVSSGSTLGNASAIASTVYVYAIDNAGTIELGVSSTKFADNTIQSSTAEGGAGAADSASVLYSTTARSNMPIRLIGTIVSTQATAGTWASSPTQITTAVTGIAPILQAPQTNQTGAVATGSTVIPLDDTIPQSGEGDQYMTQAITPVSATSLLKVEVVINMAANSNITLTAALFRDATASSVAAANTSVTTGAQITSISFVYFVVSGSLATTTFKVRAGPSSGTTVTFNGLGGGRSFGGVMMSSLTITEYTA